jgi:hypothetical protein
MTMRCQEISRAGDGDESNVQLVLGPPSGAPPDLLAPGVPPAASPNRSRHEPGCRGALKYHRPPGDWRPRSWCFFCLRSLGLGCTPTGSRLAGRVLRRPCFGIAARKGVVCPYGPWDRADWNHCQPTSVKIIMAENPLRATVTAEGPSNLGDIFEAGNPLIESMTSAADSLFRATPMPVRLLEAFVRGPNGRTQMVAEGRAKRPRVAMRRVVAKSARQHHCKVGSDGNSIRA